MKRVLFYGTVGVLAYVVFLAATLPAAQAYGWYRDSLGPLVLQDIHGSVWSGRASALEVGALRFESFSWELHRWGLLLGRLDADWNFGGPGARGRGHVERRNDGVLSLDQVRAHIPVKQVAAVLRDLPVELEGDLGIELGSLQLDGNRVLAAEGTITVQDLLVVSPGRLALGDFELTLETTDDGIKGTLVDRGGPVEAEGVFHLGPGGRYRFEGAFDPRDAGTPELVEGLRQLGPRGPDGRTRVSLSGALPAVSRL